MKHEVKVKRANKHVERWSFSNKSSAVNFAQKRMLDADVLFAEVRKTPRTSGHETIEVFEGANLKSHDLLFTFEAVRGERQMSVRRRFFSVNGELLEQLQMHDSEGNVTLLSGDRLEAFRNLLNK